MSQKLLLEKRKRLEKILSGVKGYSGIFEIFKYIKEILKQKGRLIIYDWLKPSPQKIILKIKTKKIERKFLKFVNDFKPRKVKYEKIKDGYLIDIADGIEFLTKYKAEGKEWEEEMRETHFFFTEEDFEKFFNKVGFIVKSKGKYTMFVKKQINF